MSEPVSLEYKTLAVANPVEPDASGVIEALVAVTGVKDEVGDIIVPGAFARTLTERPRPKVCLGHDWNRPIGRTTEIRELMPGDSRLPKRTADGRPWPRAAGALWARFEVNLDSDDGRGAFSAAKFFGPAESTFSIGYRTKKARQRGSVRSIDDLDLFEYGPVLNPANRLATLQSIKAAHGELTNPVDSERQDFETGSGDVESKTKYVRDAAYWGKPLGTPITPGMKPRGGHDRTRGVSDTKPTASSVFASLPRDEQDAVRALPAEQRTTYLRARAAGQNHTEALTATGSTTDAHHESPKRATPRSDAPNGSEKKPARAATHDDVPADDAPAKRKPWKPSAKQQALILGAQPGSVQVRRKDDAGNIIYGPPYPRVDGLVFSGHNNSALPLVREGYALRDVDARTHVLTEKGEQLRAELGKSDSERQRSRGRELAAAALGFPIAAVADPNVDADAPAMALTPDEFVDARMASQARRERAKAIAEEQAKADQEDADAARTAQIAKAAPATIDLAALQLQRETAARPGSRQSKIELAAGGRLAIVGAGTKNWSIITADSRGIVNSSTFVNDSGKPIRPAALRGLAEQIAGLTDASGHQAPFTHPDSGEWARGWRDADGRGLQERIADITDAWATENGMTSRFIRPGRSVDTTPGGAPDADGWRMRRAAELAPGDEVRLPNGSAATIVRNGGGDTGELSPQAKRELGDAVLLSGGTTVTLRELAGLEPTPGPYDTDPAHLVIPIRFAPGADDPNAGLDPGMGAMAATGSPPGRAYDRDDIARWHGRSASESDSYTPLPEGTRIAYQPSSISYLPRDTRPVVGTLLPLVEAHGGDLFQSVRLDDGTYDQFRVAGIRSGSPDPDGRPAFETNPDDKRIDAIRVERGLPPVAASTPLRRDAEPPSADAEPDAPQAEGRAATAEADPAKPKTRAAKPPKLVATALPPERETLPYKVIVKPNRAGQGARVRYNGREYSVDAAGGALAQVTVTDDDGHAATVSGGSTTLLVRERSVDRERALRQALAQAEAQHRGEVDNAQGEATVSQTGTPTPEPEAPAAPEPEAPSAPEPEAPGESELAEIPGDQIDEAAALQDEVLGIVEQPDGTIEVTEEVADRQDRVAALIDADDAGSLNLGQKSTEELTGTRTELSEELKLQSVLATRQATPKPTIVTSPAGAAPKPPQRPGLAGAAEDYAEALRSGDAEAIARTRARMESSLRRSRAGSASARELADHITGEGDDDAERLAGLARSMRTESRERRNASARRRRTARRLERVRIQSIIDKIDSELQGRARTTEAPPEARAPFVPAFQRRYGGMTFVEMDAAEEAARQRGDVSTTADLRMIASERDRRSALVADVAKAPDAPATEPTIEPADEPVERREPRSAASLREEIDKLERQMARVAGTDDNDDNAIVNLSPNSRSRAARNAGRRRFSNLDRDLARYTELRQRRDNLRSSLARAEAREKRTERETQPTIDKAALANAEMIRDSRDGGWKKVRRVNATTVTVEPRYAGLDAPKIPHSRIIAVQTSEDVAGKADTLAANYLEMHGTDGVRTAVERLRKRTKLSKGDQALLTALEGQLTNRDNSANVKPMTADQIAAASDDDLAAMLGEYSDNDDVVGMVLAEMDRRQRDAEVTTAISEDEQWKRFDELMAAGWDAESATEEALGIPVDQQRRERAISMLRGQGYAGTRLEDLARKSYRDHVFQAYRSAEDATREHLLTREGQNAEIDPEQLFSGPEARARRWASDELKQWWDDNGRETFEDHKARLLGGQAAYRGSEGAFLA